MIRWATVDDADDLADVHVATWQAAYARMLPAEFLGTIDRAARARWWRRFIGDGARVHVAEIDRVVGFCHATGSSDDGWGEIYSIYVHPDNWGDGHGHDLLQAGEDTLRATGFETALLWVLDANQRARRFYERHGWTVGKPIRVEEIGGVQVTEVRYEKSLTAAP